MRRGRPHKPIISIESVSAALKMLDYSTQQSPTHQALTNLLLVDIHLQLSRHTHVEDVREWILRNLLVDIITQQVNAYRSNFGLSAIKRTESVKVAITQLRESFGDTSDYLQGWHFLYIRYVRPDLGFSMQQLAQYTNTTARTLQRHQQKAIYLLRDRLIALESEARQTHHQIYLRQQIRGQITPLVGRDQEMQSVMSHFQKAYPEPVVISGEAGIGKTALVTAITDKLITQNLVDEILWLQHIEQLDNIPIYIWDKLHLRQSASAWQECLQYTKLVIVLDGADTLDLTSEEWQELTYDLRGAYLLLTRRDSVVNQGNILQISLQGLAEAACYALIENRLVNSNIISSDMLSICQGIPARLIRYANYVNQYGNSQLDTSEFLKDVWGQELTLQAIVSVIFWWLSDGNLPIPLVDTIQKHILTDNITTTHFNLAKQSYLENATLKDVLGQFVDRMMLEISDNIPLQEFLLIIGSTDWIDLSSAAGEALLEQTQVESLSKMGLFRWRYMYTRISVSHPHFIDRLTIQLQYGIVLRCLRKGKDAQIIFRSVIEQAGQLGNFELQNAALYELAQLFQAQGELDAAADIYADLLRMQSFSTSHSQTKLQLARIELERQRGESALSLLDGIQDVSSRIDILICEAHLLLDEHDYLDIAIPNKLALPFMHPRDEAALHTIWGRSYLKRHQISEAIIHLNEGLLLAEQVGDNFDAARARLNLCALYLTNTDEIDTSLLNEIEEQLKIALTAQRVVGDSIGIEASLHNLGILTRLKAI